MKVYGPEPVPPDPEKVISGAASPSQTVGLLSDMVAEGFGLMVTTADLVVKGWIHRPSVTDNNLIDLVPGLVVEILLMIYRPDASAGTVTGPEALPVSS